MGPESGAAVGSPGVPDHNHTLIPVRSSATTQGAHLTACDQFLGVRRELRSRADAWKLALVDHMPHPLHRPEKIRRRLAILSVPLYGDAIYPDLPPHGGTQLRYDGENYTSHDISPALKTV